MTVTSRYPSSHQAQAILRAWTAGDRVQLHEELGRVSEISSEISDTAEQERVELLAEIAKQWRMAVDHVAGKQEKLYSNLLEHLAQ